jgi:hypothetical protein
MSAVLVPFVLAGLVWGGVYLLRGSLLAGCLVYLLLVNCFGLFFYRIEIGPTLSLDRLWIGVLCLAYVVQRRLGGTEPKPLTKTDWLLGALLGLVSASTVFEKLSGNGLETSDTPIVMHLVNGYLIPACLYWIARQSRLGERAWGALLAAATVFGAYLALTGLAEAAQAWAFVFPRYIADPAVGLHFGRARGPMVQSVSFGLYLGVCWLAILVWRRRLGRFGNLAVWLAAPLVLAAIGLTYTRSVWLGVGLGGAIVLWLTLRGAWRPVVLGSVLAAGLLVGVTNADKILSLNRGDNTASQTRDSASLRKSFVYVSWQMFRDRPLLGVGFGQFTRAKLPYLADRSTDLRLEPIRDWTHHNTFLSLLTELGAVGLVLYTGVLVAWVRLAWRLARDSARPAWQRDAGVLLLGALAVFTVQAACHEVTFGPLDHGLLFFLAGVGMAAASPCAGRRQAPRISSETEFVEAPHPAEAALR